MFIKKSSKKRRKRQPIETGVPGLHEQGLAAISSSYGLYVLPESKERWVIYNPQTGKQIATYMTMTRNLLIGNWAPTKMSNWVAAVQKVADLMKKGKLPEGDSG